MICRWFVLSSFMDIGWQHNNPPNPADAALDDLQAYDNHLYYSYV